MSNDPNRTTDHVPDPANGKRSPEHAAEGTVLPGTASLPNQSNTPISETADASRTRSLSTATQDRAANAAGITGAVPGYELLGELGRGGMGVVYKARQLSLNRLVALKMILAAGADDSPIVVRFLAEAEVVASIRHPNVVQVYDYGHNDGRPFMALEFLSGGTLADRLKGGPCLAPRDAAALVEKIARGVQAAHGRGIIHRDLKPGNVLFDEMGEPKVADFGLAKRASSELTQTGAVMGTPAYMAPEQAGGRTHDIGPPADVWALGVILYECLTGTRPFTADRVDELLAKVLLSEPDSLRSRSNHLPRDLDTICRKCLAKEPHQRYPSAMALAQDLERFQAGEPILAKPEGQLRKAWRRIRRRGLTLGLFAALVVSVGFGAWLVMQSSSQRRVNDLSQRINEELDKPEWPAGHRASIEGLADELAALSPEQADAARKKLTERVGRRFRETITRPRVQARDIPELQAEIAWVSAHDAELGAALSRELNGRLRSWSPILDLGPPFAGAGEAFAAGTVAVAADWLSRVSAGWGAVATRTPSRGPLRVEVEFTPGWEDTGAVGVVIHLPTAPGADASRGYAFRLVPAARAVDPDAASAVAAAPPKTFRASAGLARAELVRDRIVLRSQIVQTAFGSIRLSAERAGDALRLRVNDLPPLEFSDPVPLLAGDDAVLGIIWPHGAGITRLRADTLILPPTPSPLEKADHLYESGKLADAVAVYLDQVRASPDSETATEARCKAGMALAVLNRVEEAATMFEQAMLRPGDRWPVIAGCQLWLLRLKQQKFEEADAALTNLAGRFNREQIAMYVPAEVRYEIRDPYARSLGVNYLLPDPGQISQLEALGKVAELIADDESRDGVFHRLRIMLLLTRQDARAEEIGRRLLASAETHRHGDELAWQWFFWALRWQCWNLRQLNLRERAANELQQIAQRQAHVLSGAMKLTPTNAGLLTGFLSIELERARLFADMGKWEQAEAALDHYLKMLPRPVWNYSLLAEAHLMKGFCRLERGDPEGARKAWSAGRWTVFVEQLPADRRPADIIPVGRQGLLEGWTLASLCDEMSDEDGKRYWSGLMEIVVSDPIVTQFSNALAISPAIMRGTWRSPRGRELARKMAFLQLHPVDYYRAPILLLAYEKVRQDLFAGQPSQEADGAAWQVASQTFTRFLDGKLSKTQAIQGTLAWKGTFGLLGWGGLARDLPPDARGPIAWLMGVRYVKLGKLDDARALFRTAIMDTPKESLVARLAAEELAKLDGKPLPQSLPIAPPPREIAR